MCNIRSNKPLFKIIINLQTLPKYIYICTHHYLRLAAVPLTIVVRGNHLKLKIRSPHVPVHDRRLHYSAVWLNDKSVLAVFCVSTSLRGDDEPVHHWTVVPSVFIQSLGKEENHLCDIIIIMLSTAIAIIMKCHRHAHKQCDQVTVVIIIITNSVIYDSNRFTSWSASLDRYIETCHLQYIDWYTSHQQRATCFLWCFFFFFSFCLQGSLLWDFQCSDGLM